MNRDGHNSVKFFIGGEVEKTPAFSKKTLFVVDFQDTNRIESLAREHKAPHIFLGANHSFDASYPTEYFSKCWNDQITYLLDKGFMVTLDYQAHQHETVLKMLNAGIWQCRNFVPLLGVRIPNIETSSPNLTIKIDDIDFKATNPGVWCMHFKEITDSNRFTDWLEYETDVTISEDKTISTNVTESAAKEYVDFGTRVDKMLEASFPKNDESIGLDPDSKSQLKPASEDEQAKEAIQTPISTSAEVSEAYAKGATSDPLGKAVPKKSKVTKAKE